MTYTDDVLINKAATIERCIKRIHEEYRGDKSAFLEDYTRQDSVVLNLQRCCEAAIDMGNRHIKLNSWAIPQSSRDVFQILANEKIIKPELADNLKSMIGLRNIAVHDYQTLNMDIVISVLEKHLIDFNYYIKALIQ